MQSSYTGQIGTCSLGIPHVDNVDTLLYSHPSWHPATHSLVSVHTERHHIISPHFPSFFPIGKKRRCKWKSRSFGTPRFCTLRLGAWTADILRFSYSIPYQTKLREVLGNRFSHRKGGEYLKWNGFPWDRLMAQASLRASFFILQSFINGGIIVWPSWSLVACPIIRIFHDGISVESL